MHLFLKFSVLSSGYGTKDQFQLCETEPCGLPRGGKGIQKDKELMQEYALVPV